jgi:hypothetical protein
MDDLRNSILDKLMMATEAQFPLPLLKKSDEYFFFEYKRN